MKEVIIEVFGDYKYKPVVLVDGNRMNYVRRDGRYVVDFETDKDKVNVKVVKYLEINGRFWLLWELLYSILSLFGLLDFRADRRCICYDLSFDVKTQQPLNTVWVGLRKPKKDGFAAQLKASNGIWVMSNKCFVDKKARRRVILIRLIRLVMLVGFAVGLYFLIS